MRAQTKPRLQDGDVADDKVIAIMHIYSTQLILPARVYPIFLSIESNIAKLEEGW